MKEKHIERNLWIAVILILLTGLMATQCSAQQNITKRTVTLDSLSSRQDRIWLTDGKGGVAWIRISGDTLYLGDNSGEKFLGELKNTGSITSDTVDIIYINDTVKFLANGAYMENSGNGHFKLSDGSGYVSISHGIPYAGHSGAAGIITGYIDFSGGNKLAGFSKDTVSVVPDSAVAWSAEAIKSYVADHGGSGGGGVVDTAGGQLANQIPYWTDNNTLGGDPDLTFTNGNSLSVPKIVSTLQGGGSVSTNGTIIGEGGYAFNVSNTNGFGIVVNGYTNTAIRSTASTGKSFMGRYGTGSATDTIIIISDSVQFYYLGESTDNDRILSVSQTGKVKTYSPPASLQIEVTTETLVSGADSVYVLTIPESLAGMNLIKLEAYPGSVTGDRTMSVEAYRKRSTTVVQMTSAGASFTTNATIHTSYDDVQRGDKIAIGWTFTGGTTSPVGLIVQLTFQKP